MATRRLEREGREKSMGKREGRQVWVKDLGIKVAKRREKFTGKRKGEIKKNQ